MAEELSSPNHYVSCTGDYDCAADEHIEGCGIVDKRAPLEHGEAVDDHPYRRSDERSRARYDTAERAILDVLGTYRDVVESFDIGFRNHRRLSGRGDNTYAVRHEPRSVDF